MCFEELLQGVQVVVHGVVVFEHADVGAEDVKRRAICAHRVLPPRDTRHAHECVSL